MTREVSAAGVDQAGDFGYRQELRRDFSRWSNLAIGFAFISPVVGLYTVFQPAVRAAGQRWWWALVVALAGQILVALVFAELAAQYPLAGGVYQWSHRLVNAPYGWFAGWVYSWALIAVLSATAFGAATYLARFLWEREVSEVRVTELALGVLVCCVILNAAGGAGLRFILGAGVASTLVGSLGIAVILVVTRTPPIDTLIKPSGSFAWAPFSAALAFAGWAFIGFDACAGVAEETRDAARVVPRMIVTALSSVGLVVVVTALIFTLAIPRALGTGSNLIVGTLIHAFGPTVTRPILVLVVVTYLACCLAVQTTVSRTIYSFSRDGMLPGSRYLRYVPGTRGVPVNAVVATGILAGIFTAWSRALNVLVLFSTSGLYTAFGFAVGAALFGRLTGRWRPGSPFTLGRAGLPISVVAFVWLLCETVNLAWPRGGDVVWYDRYASPVAGSILLALGLAYFALSRPDRRWRRHTYSDVPG